MAGRFIEMRSFHQVVCSCFVELKLFPRSGWIKSLTCTAIQEVLARLICIFICILMLGF